MVVLGFPAGCLCFSAASHACECCDPVNFVAENLGIQSYPNPCHDYLYLFETQNRLLRYEILDVIGMRMAMGSLVNNSNRIDVSNLKPGEYFIRLTDKKTNKKTTITFIKI